jgi:hypothetical protein
MESNFSDQKHVDPLNDIVEEDDCKCYDLFEGNTINDIKLILVAYIFTLSIINDFVSGVLTAVAHVMTLAFLSESTFFVFYGIF